MTIANEILTVLTLLTFFTLDKLDVFILNLAVSIVYKVPSMNAKDAPT